MNPMIYAILAATSASFYGLSQKIASRFVDQLFGAVVISLIAASAGGCLLLTNWRGQQLYSNPKGLIFLFLSGLAALSIDYFTLKAYGSGLPLSIGGPLIIAVNIALTTLVGISLGEGINLAKVSGLLFVLVGASLLATLGR